MIYDIAELRVKINNKFPYTDKFCADYLSPDQDGDFDLEIDVSDEEFNEEKQKSPNFNDADYTYEQYAALESVPELEVLMQHIVERNPLVEYYASGAEYPRTGEARTIEALNKVIANGMEGFVKLNL